MRSTLFIILLSGYFFQACGSGAKGEKTSVKSIPATESKTTVVAESSSVKGGAAIKITKDEFLKKVWNYQTNPQEWKYLGDKPAIIDFYADWCGPCKIASPILDEIAVQYAGKINVIKIDTEKERELASVFGIQSIPAFLYIPKNGKPIMMAGIGRSKEETKQMFIANIQKYLLVNN